MWKYRYPRGETGYFFKQALVKKWIENIPKLRCFKEEIIRMDCGEHLGYTIIASSKKRKVDEFDCEKKVEVRKNRWERLKKIAQSKESPRKE